MKYKFGYCHVICLVNGLAGFLAVSGAGIITKYVCTGDSVQAFQNITFNNCSSVVSLYIKGERNALIARWSFENCSRNETLLPDYKERVSLYRNGIISIYNVHPWDQAKYIVKCQMGNISMEDVVEIQVMAAPANDCKPKILHLGSNLFASLKAHSCGKPVATLYWRGYGDIPNTTGAVLKLNPGNQGGTYYACIKGPALTCVRNALDYCSTITTGRYKSPPILLETWDVKMAIIIVAGIVSGISLLAIAVILVRMYCIQNDFPDAHFMPLLQMDLHRPTHDDMLSGQHTVPLKNHYELRKKHLDQTLVSLATHHATYCTHLRSSQAAETMGGRQRTE